MDKQSKALGFSFQYFDAIKPSHGNLYISKERLGCLRSHREVIKLALQNDWDSVLILEDDCQFRNETGQIFIEGMENLPDFELLYLGGTLWKAKTQPINKWFKSGTGILTTHSYVVPKKNYQKLLDLFEDESKPVDVLLAEFQESNKTIIFTRNITRQIEGYSDIEKRNRLNNYIFDN